MYQAALLFGHNYKVQVEYHTMLPQVSTIQRWTIVYVYWLSSCMLPTILLLLLLLLH